MRHNEFKKKVNEGGLADMAQRAEQDHEVQMARSDLYKLAKYSIKLHDMLKMVPESKGIEGWQAAKITKAADYISSVFHNLDYEMKFAEQKVAEAKKNSYKDGLGAVLESKIKEKAVSTAQRRAAAIALQAKKGEIPKSELQGASRSMMNMSTKDLEDFAKGSEEGLPDKVSERRNEGSGKNTQATRQTRTSALPDGLQKQIINLTKRGLSPADILKKFQMKYPDLKLAQVKSVAQNMEESTEKLCPDCGKPSWRTMSETEAQKGVDGKRCWKGYRRMGTKKKGGKTVDNCVKVG